LEPLGAVFFDWIKNYGFEPLEDQAVSPFNLIVAPGVCHGGIVDVDAAFLAETPELRTLK
jgi:hypothetical protein